MLDLIQEKFIAAVIAALVSAGVGGIIAWLTAKKNQKKKEIEDLRGELKELKERDEIFKNSIRAMLRQDIINTHDKYMARGWAEIYVKDNMQDMFKNYTALEGNGTVPRLVEEFMDLPTRKEDKK